MPLVGGWWGAGAGLEAAVGPYVDYANFEAPLRHQRLLLGLRVCGPGRKRSAEKGIRRSPGSLWGGALAATPGGSYS
jgi:hypothetical protein